MPPKMEAVKVVVRCRPMNTREKDKQCKGIIQMNFERGEIYITNPNARQGEHPKTFTFDHVYDWNAEQTAVYRETAAPIVANVIDGFNGTIFAYGQTGAGKTWTMEGLRDPPSLQGIIPQSFEDIFDKITLSDETQFLVRASYLEIYQEEIRDLLGKGKEKLALKESKDRGVFVQGLSSFVVKGFKEIDHVMSIGSKNRMVGATLMNAGSSRSHAIFTITIEASVEIPGKDEPRIHVGKLNLVDLAGSERQAKTGATGDRLKEGAKINLSLSALGNVISALVDGKSKHIPFRDSKLTRMLQDSLGGNTKTVMVANCSPADDNYDETLSTLKYADRAKQIKNKPKINEDPKDALLREYQEEIMRLKEMLMSKGATPLTGTGPAGTAPPQHTKSGTEISQEMIEELKRKNQTDMAEILKSRGYAIDEIEEIGKKIAETATKQHKERKAAAALEKKLKMMQEKLLGGKEHLADLNRKQEASIRQKQLMLEQRHAEEDRLKRELVEAEEKRMLIQEQFENLQQEAVVKTKKLKTLIRKWKSAEREVKDMHAEFETERQDLLDAVRELTDQYKLKMMIVENFVPMDEIKKIENRATWDEDKEEWFLKPLQLGSKNKTIKRPLSAYPGNNRPTSAFAAAQKSSSANSKESLRFKASNILNIDLELPERRTTDYEGVSALHAANTVLKDALKNDPDIDEIEVQVTENLPNVYLSEPTEFTTPQPPKRIPEHHTEKEPKKRLLRPQTLKNEARLRSKSEPPNRKNENEESQFPSSRGLVSSQRGSRIRY